MPTLFIFQNTIGTGTVEVVFVTCSLAAKEFSITVELYKTKSSTLKVVQTTYCMCKTKLQ